VRGTGSDDYIWISPTGRGEFYGNTHAFDPPKWDVGTKSMFDLGVDRKSIQLADFDGDGKCDVLVTRKSDGAVRMYRNEYDAATSTFKFTDQGFVHGTARCTEGWGVGLRDLGLRFADIE
jgi:hypothetical protein